MASVERNDDPTEAGVDRNRDQVFLRGGLSGRRSLGEQRRGKEAGEEQGDSVKHGPDLYEAFPLGPNLL